MTLGRSIRLFLVDGTPGGLIVAEIINWTGHVIQAPRSSLGELLERPEMTRTGVYILTGEDPDNPGQTLAYIGESDVVDQRLRQHSRSLEFWDKVTVITSKDHNLTKGHVKYLECRMIETAKLAGRVKLNQISPNPVHLPEADISDMASFMDYCKIVLPVIGLDLLKEVPPTAASEITDQETMIRRSPIFVLKENRAGLQAQAQEVDGEFIVMAGSLAKATWSSTHHHAYESLHRSLVERGKLIANGDNQDLMVFSENTPFRSPSAASAVIFGRNDNGRLSWILENSDKTYAQWQDELVESVEDENQATNSDS